MIYFHYDWDEDKKDKLDESGDYCYHVWKSYIGFHEVYEYCEKCGKKRDKDGKEHK